MPIEQKLEKQSLLGDFITIATMHIKNGHPEEAEKVMQSAIKTGRYEDAKIIGQLLDASRE